MRFKKFIFFFLGVVILSTASVGTVFSVVQPVLNASDNGAGGLTIMGSFWSTNSQVKIYWDMQTADHLLAQPTTDWGGSFSTTIPLTTAVSLGTHSIIAVQGAKTATAAWTVTSVSPPDDRTLNQINQGNTGIQNQLSNIQSQLSSMQSNIDTKIDSIKALQILGYYTGQYTFHTNNVAPGTDISASQAVIFIVTVRFTGLTGDTHVFVSGLTDGHGAKEYSNNDVLDTITFASHFTSIGRTDTESDTIDLSYSIMVLGTPGTTLTVH